MASLLAGGDANPWQRKLAAKRIGGNAIRVPSAALKRTKGTVRWAMPLTVVKGMDEAVRAAASAAVHGDVVLLAPACASFDAYSDFIARGEHFRRLAMTVAVGAAHGA